MFLSVKRYELIKMLEEYKKLIEESEHSNLELNYENMVLNIIDVVGV